MLAEIEIDYHEAKKNTDHSRWRYKRYGPDDRQIERENPTWLILGQWNCPSVAPIPEELCPIFKARNQELGRLAARMISERSETDMETRREAITAFVRIFFGVKKNPEKDKKMGHNLSRFFAAVKTGSDYPSATRELLSVSVE